MRPNRFHCQILGKSEDELSISVTKIRTLTTIGSWTVIVHLTPWIVTFSMALRHEVPLPTDTLSILEPFLIPHLPPLISYGTAL